MIIGSERISVSAVFVSRSLLRDWKSDVVYKNLCKNDRLRQFIAIELVYALSLAYGLEPLFTFRCLD